MGIFISVDGIDTLLNWKQTAFSKLDLYNTIADLEGQKAILLAQFQDGMKKRVVDINQRAINAQAKGKKATIDTNGITLILTCAKEKEEDDPNSSRFTYADSNNGAGN